MSSAKTIVSGFGEADAVLGQIPLLLRGTVLNKALKAAIQRINAASMAAAPAQGRSVGGIPYTPRRGERAARSRLARSIGSVIRQYKDTTVGIGGPVKSKVGRHAHLVEFGFTHVTGGTVMSGGRERYATRKVGYTLRRKLDPSKGVSASNISDAEEFIAGTRFRRADVEKLRRLGLVTERREKTDRTGKGKRGGHVPGRPFVRTAFEANKAAIQQEVLAALRKFADELTRKYNKQP